MRDEIGHLQVTPNGARPFFQLVNARYERAPLGYPRRR